MAAQGPEGAEGLGTASGEGVHLEALQAWAGEVRNLLHEWHASGLLGSGEFRDVIVHVNRLDEVLTRVGLGAGASQPVAGKG